MDQYLSFKRYTRGCPPWLLKKIRRVSAHPKNVADVDHILECIIEEFSDRKFLISYTKNFRLSRFLPISEILVKRLRTCGALATVVASVFRSLGVPTKLINGWYVKRDENSRHAWNELYISSVHRFVPFDITRKNFRLDRHHKRKDEWVDWSDLEKVYSEQAK